MGWWWAWQCVSSGPRGQMSQDIEDILFTLKEVAGWGGPDLVDTMVVEGRKPSELARAHGVARSWLYAITSRRAQGIEIQPPLRSR